MKKRIMIWLLIIPLMIVAALFIYPHLATVPDDLGIKDGRLKEAPDTPNCVSSFAPEDDQQHYISPMPYNGDTAETFVQIKTILADFPRFKIVKAENNYLYIEATTLVFRYVDDLEIFLDDKNKLIHFRSASRIGQSDFGANRKRVEQIKAALNKL